MARGLFNEVHHKSYRKDWLCYILVHKLFQYNMINCTTSICGSPQNSSRLCLKTKDSWICCIRQPAYVAVTRVPLVCYFNLTGITYSWFYARELLSLNKTFVFTSNSSDISSRFMYKWVFVNIDLTGHPLMLFEVAVTIVIFVRWYTHLEWVPANKLKSYIIRIQRPEFCVIIRIVMARCRAGIAPNMAFLYFNILSTRG
jgi:hypothetical protein